MVPERVARRRRRDGAGGPAAPPRGRERPGAHPRGHTDPTRLAGPATTKRRRVGVFPIDLGVYNTCCWIPSVSINAIGLFFVRWAAGKSIARNAVIWRVGASYSACALQASLEKIMRRFLLQRRSRMHLCRESTRRLSGWNLSSSRLSEAIRLLKH